jgi:hypothetical protein
LTTVAVSTIEHFVFEIKFKNFDLHDGANRKVLPTEGCEQEIEEPTANGITSANIQIEDEAWTLVMRRRNRRQASKGGASLVKSKFTKTNMMKVKKKKAKFAPKVNASL